MKRIYVAIAVGMFFLLSAVSSYAQNAGPKIAYVDLTRVFDEYNKTKEYDASLQTKSSGYEQERNARLEKIKDAQGKLAVMKEDEKKKLQAQIDKDRADLMEYDRQKQTDLRKERDERIREILAEIEKVVKDYAQQEKYTFVLNDKVLIYGDQTLDVTNQIIKLLNEKYPAKK